ncbi:MAG: 30S ribosomal protein S20 [Candidatus Omnitrophica bacterium]|nr:30S ribosomal protein S20 [Candidatus Omnitrophota bacterium]
MVKCFLNTEEYMPRRKTSLKRKRADKKRRLRNIKVKHQLKKTLKKFQALLAAKNITEAKSLLGKVFSELDKAAKKRIIHPRTANRKKSRLVKRLSKTR